ncbi:MAG TPA: hypothetical protein VMR70_03820, partial [Flavisolibacter sp.]|nr:hypothetical protein [Flavisolibacter sp.]
MKRTFLLPLLLAGCFQLAAQTPYPAAPPAAPAVVKAEYFFDTDPGPGNGSPVNLPVSADIANYSQSLPLNGTALSNGIHRLYIRTMD